MSRPVVHPLPPPPPPPPLPMEVEGAVEPVGQQPVVEGVEEQVGQQPTVRMDDVPGKPGTSLGLIFRSVQFICGLVTLAIMASTSFTSVPFSSFVLAASGVMCVWSLLLAFLDVYALLVKRHLRHALLSQALAIGDGVIGAALVGSASMSGGISWFVIGFDLCKNEPCASYATSTAFAYLGSIALTLSFFLNVSSWGHVRV